MELKRHKSLFNEIKYSVTTEKMSYQEASHFLAKSRCAIKTQDIIRKYNLEDQLVDLIQKAELKS